MFIFFDVIAPLFNSFEELREGDLYEAVNRLASTLKFPLKK